MINPTSVAFDIDGVFADIMSLFIDIACDEYNISGIKYEDITSYFIEDCLNIKPEIINEIINRILDGNYLATLRPIDQSPEVLTRLGRSHSPILFVTARPYIGPIQDWILDVLPLESSSIDIVATGSFEGKTDVLLSRNITHFVEDRLETCFQLNESGVTPILFKQPWNRSKHPFLEIDSWNELESMIKF